MHTSNPTQTTLRNKTKMRFSLLTVSLGFLLSNGILGEITPECSKDIHEVTQDLTSAGIAIAKAVDDCADDFTSQCNDDINDVLNDLTAAAQDITNAIYDCNGEVPTQCANDINAILVDITEATTAIMDAVIDCPNSNAKCTADIAKASKAIGSAIRDTAAAVNDC
jgi:hypothetical protein